MDERHKDHTRYDLNKYFQDDPPMLKKFSYELILS